MNKKDNDKMALIPKSQRTPPEDISFFTTPLSARGWPRWFVFLMMGVAILYILNPTLGLFEFIPDTIPVIGNLDEGVAFLLIWMGLLEIFEGKKYQTPNTTSATEEGKEEEPVIETDVKPVDERETKD